MLNVKTTIMAKDGELVKKGDLVEVKGTGKSKFFEKNKKKKLHKLHAETLIKKGTVEKV